MSCLTHGGKISGVESGSSRSDCLEKGQQYSFPNRGVSKFKKEKVQSREENQNSRHRQNYFGLHTVFPNMKMVTPDVFPGKKTDTSNNDQQSNHNGNDRVGRITGKRRKGFSDSQQVKSCVTKSGYGMEKGKPQSLYYSKIGRKSRKEQGGANEFDDEGHPQNKPDQADDTAYLRGGNRSCIALLCINPIRRPERMAKAPATVTTPSPPI